ncbi:MAG: glycosyltransferase family 2 protein [Deltaproteobacteria bacterium]|nr:glycosyltransferase family 2 protein [Deltaproteobacteria bacterium]
MIRINIINNENIGGISLDLKNRLIKDDFLIIEIPADYLILDNFEKRLDSAGILITEFEYRGNLILLKLTSASLAVSLTEEALNLTCNRGLFDFNPDNLSLTINGNNYHGGTEKFDFTYLKTCFLTFPFGSLKEIYVKNIIENFDYDENEFFFKEFYRMTAFGGSLHLEAGDIPFYLKLYNEAKIKRPDSIDLLPAIKEYEKISKESSENRYKLFAPEMLIGRFIKDNNSKSVYSHDLLKAYLEYCGFINVFPRVSAADYEAGKIRIDALKLGLKEFAALPKKVLLRAVSGSYDDLPGFSVFIRNLHNAYNNWDLYLITDNCDFFENNIYLKYLGSTMTDENVDYTIVLDNAKNLPAVDYALKFAGSGKPDIFISENDVIEAYNFLRSFGINPNEKFAIFDLDFIDNMDSKEEIDILNIIKKDFPYLKDFKVLNISLKEQNTLTLKKLSVIISLASFYAGGGFFYGLADGSRVPSYNKEINKFNYKRGIEDIDLSIIIPVFNNIEYTKNCLNSLFKNHPLSNFEIIVINNASTDKTEEFLNDFDYLDNFTVIRNDSNLGYAKACNQGAKISKGKYLYFLNNDTVVLKGAIDELFDTIENAGDKCGIAGSLLLYPDGKLQHGGVAFSQEGTAYHLFRNVEIIGCKNLMFKNAIFLKKCNGVTAASMVIKKDVFFAVGTFDESYKNGFEDVDLCLKVRRLKKDIIFNPKSMLIHFEERTEGRKKFDMQNQIIFQNKWKFSFGQDDNIFAEISNIRMFLEPMTFRILNYYSVSEIKRLEEELYKLFNLGNYKGALEIAEYILKYDFLNIKVYRKKIEIEMLQKK